MMKFVHLMTMAAMLLSAGGGSAHAGGCTDWEHHQGYWSWAKHDLILIEQAGHNDCSDDPRPQLFRWTLYDRHLERVAMIERDWKQQVFEKRLSAEVRRDLKALTMQLKRTWRRHRRKTWSTALTMMGLVPLKRAKKCPAQIEVLDRAEGEIGVPQVRVFVKDRTLRSKLTLKRLQLGPSCDPDDEEDMGCSSSLDGATVACYKINKGTLVEVNGSYGSVTGGTVSPELLLIMPGELTAKRENILGLRAMRAQIFPAALYHFGVSLRLRPDLPLANYNMACLLALIGRPFAEGEPYLGLALQGGGRAVLKQIKVDKDLASWRRNKEFVGWMLKLEREGRRRK